MANAVTSQTLSQAVADHLRRLIHLGEVGPGDRLPAERELAEQRRGSSDCSTPASS